MISKKIIDRIRVSTACKAHLMLALDKSAITIQRYLDDNDIMLTTKPALEVIMRVLEVDENEIFETNNQ